MSVPRIAIRLLVDTPAHAETIRQAVADQVATRPRYQDRVEQLDVVADEEDRGTVVRLDVRITTRAERDALRDWLRSQLADHATVRAWIRGVRIETHHCSHDEADPRPCSETEHQVVLERGLPI